MAVEVFFNNEFEDVVFDSVSQDEWKELVKELGISGQERVLSKEAGSPIPYPFMNVGMERVYEVLCPNKKDFQKYDSTPIPLEALKTIKFCLKENYFNEIEIWADDKAPDPIAVGKTCEYYCYDIKDKKGHATSFDSKDKITSHKDFAGGSIYSRAEKKYLLARWGDELRPFEELKEKALKIREKLSINTLKKKISDLEKDLSTAVEDNILYFEGRGFGTALPF